MSIVVIIVQVLLGLAFLGAGSLKLAGTKQSLQRRNHLQIALWFLRLTGAVEVLGALGMFVGIGVQWVSVVAAALLGATMLGAIYTHLILRKEAVQHSIAPAVLGLLALLVLIVHWADFTHLLG